MPACRAGQSLTAARRMAVTWSSFTDSNGTSVRARYIPGRVHPDGRHPSCDRPAFEQTGHSFKKDRTGRVWFERHRHLRSDTVSWWQPIEECDPAIRDLCPFGPCSTDPVAATAAPPRQLAPRAPLRRGPAASAPAVAAGGIRANVARRMGLQPHTAGTMWAASTQAETAAAHPGAPMRTKRCRRT